MRLVGLALGAVALAAPPTWAQVVDGDLTAAPIVITGRVASVRSRWVSGAIVTHVAVDVIERVRGPLLPARIVLEQLGGEVGGIGLWIADEASFREGEEALLFLGVSRRNGTLHTFEQGRGKRRIDRGLIEAMRAGPIFGVPAQSSSFVAIPPEYDPAARPVAPLFSLLPTDGGYPARWHEVDANLPVFVDHPSALPATWTGAPSNASAAVTLWRNSGMDLDLRDGGATLGGGCPATFTGNGRISVAYNDPCGVDYTAETWVVGGGYYTTGDLRTVGGVTYQKFLQGFVVLNDTGPQTSAAGCFQDAIAHGLGHALGLGHSGSASAMMAALPSATCASGPRGLAADDISGITSIYQGIPSAAAPPDAPTSLTASVVLSTVTLNWTPASTGGTVQRHLVDAGTASGVYNLGSVPFGAAPGATFANVPAGTYFVRVRAQNALGTSPPSPEASATVGACAPPPAPGTLSASVNGNAVTLLWSAPPSGVTQGYRVAVGSQPGGANFYLQDFPASVTSIGGAVPYGTYYARVFGSNVCGFGPASNEVTVVVQPCPGPPGPPTNLRFAKSGSFVALFWDAPAGTPPASYTLVVGSQPGASNLLVLPTGNTATTLGGPIGPGTYYARMLAQNPCGQSGPSNEIIVVVP